MGACVVGQRIDLVVAERDGGVGEGLGMLLQLDQLRAAGRSPHRRAVEHEHRRPIRTVRVDVDHLTGMGDSDNVGESGAHRRPSREFADRILAGPVPELSPPNSSSHSPDS